MDTIARLKNLLGPQSHGYTPLDREARPPARDTLDRTFTKAVIRLHILCLFYGLGTSVWGYVSSHRPSQVHPEPT